MWLFLTKKKKAFKEKDRIKMKKKKGEKSYKLNSKGNRSIETVGPLTRTWNLQGGSPEDGSGSWPHQSRGGRPGVNIRRWTWDTAETGGRRPPFAMPVFKARPPLILSSEHKGRQKSGGPVPALTAVFCSFGTKGKAGESSKQSPCVTGEWHQLTCGCCS